MDLMDLLKGQMGDAVMGAITNQIGANNNQKASAGMDGAMSILMNALARNAKDPQQASKLDAALERDHDGSILDDITGYLNGNSPVANTRAANGEGILKHILGGKKQVAAENLSKASGLDMGQASAMLAKMAPIVLGMLGKQKRQQGMDVSGLSSILMGAAQSANRQSSGIGGDLLTSFLDQDGDGSIVDDAAKIGGSFLKNLFRKR